MAGKSMVDRYEQILSQDPTSTVFVELAKALIEKGEHARAIDVCKTGLSHHKGSVVGRVLWGKALIHLGRPAEAMEQFDQAILIDKENPHAYNLIGEVLLRKGLYRSALPLLRKASALQPNDARVQQWLEQTQRALAGGPPPVLSEPELPAVSAPPVAEAPRRSTPAPVANPPRRPTGELFDKSAPLLNGEEEDEDASEPKTTPEVQVPEPTTAPEAHKTPEPETMRGLTGTFEALKDIPLIPQTLKLPEDEPTVVASSELFEEGRAYVQKSGSGITFAVAATRPPAVTARQRTPSGSISKSLLGDIPELEQTASIEVPKAEMSTQATEAIAKEYERELRQKLAENAAQKSFMARHGAKLAVVTVVLVAVAAAFVAYFTTRARNQGRDLADTLALAKKAIAQDTAVAYRAAAEALSTAAEMDPSSTEAWALAALAHAMLCSEHGEADHKAPAMAALDKEQVRQKYPGLTLVATYHLTDPKQRDSVRKQVLDSNLEHADVQELAGRILLARRESKAALERFKRALEMAPGNVRAKIALGNYYLDNNDHSTALNFFGGDTAKLSPKHPERVLGAAEARMALGQDLAEARREVESLSTDKYVSGDLLARRDLVYGRLLSAIGDHPDALKTLQGGLKAHKGRAYDFQLALGEALRASGDMGAARRALEAALAIKETEDVKEELGRVLIASDQEREVLRRLVPQGDARKIYLVRGIASARLKDWKKARAELARTQLSGKYPPEAVIYLALADAAEGHPDRAQEILEKTLAATKRAKAYVRVALGNVYWQRGALDKARAQFEEAVKDPMDYEGACSLGRLLIQLGLPEMAVEPLAKSITRNSAHDESRHALGRAYLQLGRTQDALQQIEQWQQAKEPGPLSHQDLAFAYYLSGRFKEAEAAIARALKLNALDGESHRIRAMVLFARGDGRGAFAALERANKLSPEDPEMFCEIGNAFIRQGNSDNATKAFLAAQRKDLKTACGRIGVHAARLPSGNKAAIKELTDLAQSAHQVWDRASAKATLARVMMSTGALKEARKAAEDAVTLLPSSGQAHLALGLVAARQKDEAAARAALGKAASLEPVMSATRLALADVLVKGSDEDVDQAMQEYEAFLRAGGSPADVARVKRVLPTLKKKLSGR